MFEKIFRIKILVQKKLQTKYLRQKTYFRKKFIQKIWTYKSRNKDFGARPIESQICVKILKPKILRLFFGTEIGTYFIINFILNFSVKLRLASRQIYKYFFIKNSSKIPNYWKIRIENLSKID